MRIILAVLGVLFVLAGAVWFLQGINVLPGSFMTGQIQWAIYGALAVAAGIALVALGTRRARGRQPQAAIPHPVASSHGKAGPGH